MRPFLYHFFMAILQPIVDLAAVCYEHGIRHVVISPGSRSAALTLAFTRHGGFEMQVVMDERSAGFIALGMALKSGIPVILVCTSGSAAYNLAPAVSEAFFQQASLIVLTADRPREWIHQLDGQAIYQSEIFGKHVKKSTDLSSDHGHKDTAWFVNRSINEAILIANTLPLGPVHLNIPIREPFYPEAHEQFVASAPLRIVRRTPSERTLTAGAWVELLEEFTDSRRILIVGGQYRNSSRLCAALSKIFEEFDIPVVGDIVTNQKGNENFISFHDVFLPVADQEELRPDLLITYGLSLVSKELKQFLRSYPSQNHWHVSEDSHLVDTFGSLNCQIDASPEYFFENLFEKVDYKLFTENSDLDNDSTYIHRWVRHNRKGAYIFSEYLRNITSLNDLSLLSFLFLYPKVQNELHIANSMPIRYANFFAPHLASQHVFANRGTNGIDGCISTAIGAALVGDNEVLLVTGDVGFLYDRNGLLINNLPRNLKIVVLNNSGGNIFGMIDGPARQPEHREYFQTAHQFSARRTAEDSGMFYNSICHPDDVQPALQAFFEHSTISLLEVFTNGDDNALVWKGLRSYISDHW
jgi:2-succinyl-5-enolpyruvyl-6-hydroxy-3-cyclohexene-1-carboxylate synthase